MMQKFKVGDKVRRIKRSSWPEDYGNFGEVYTVLSTSEGGGIEVIKGKGNAAFDCFELLEETKMTHKFKVGDRVVGNSNHIITYRIGDTGIIDGFSPYGYVVTYDSDSRQHSVSESEIDLIEEKPTVDIHNTQKKTWLEMTPEEKGALLLAHHEGKVIEHRAYDGVWIKADDDGPHWFGRLAYRVKPKEPAVETVEVWLRKVHQDDCTEQRVGTIQTIDGEPDWSTIKGETL